MIILRLILTLALPLLLGYCIVGLATRKLLKLSILERFALAWGIGLGSLGIEMFLITLLGFPLNLYTCITPVIILTVILISYLVINKITIIDLSIWAYLSSAATAIKNEKKLLKISQCILIFLISITILYVFFDALVKPIVNFDDLWRQGTIAKIVFSTGNLLTEQTIEVAGPHPFLNPLAQAWVYIGIGTWNDALGKIVFAFCFVALIFIFYTSLRRQYSRLYALLFTYFLTTFPLIVYHAGTAYSDFMQTFYYTVGIIYLFRWMQNRQTPLLYYTALFLGIGNFVKQAGIPFWVITVLILFAYCYFEYHKNFEPGVKFVLLSAFISAPWLFFHKSFLMIRLSEIAVKILAMFGQAQVTEAIAQPAPGFSYGLPTLQSILFHLGKRMFTYADWQILWFVFALVLIFNRQKIWGTKLKYLLVIILLNFIIIIYAFYDPQLYQFLVDGTLVSRLMMYHIPVVLYFVAHCIAGCIYQPLALDRKEK